MRLFRTGGPAVESRVVSYGSTKPLTEKLKVRLQVVEVDRGPLL